MTNLDEFEDVLGKAESKCTDLYIAEVRNVLNRCSSLQYYMDAMGSQFFTDNSGDTIDYERLPKTAKELLDGIAARYLELFGSLGWRVWRDHLD